MSSDRLTIAELDELERRHMEAWSTGNMGVGLRHNEILALIAAARQGIEAEACRHGFNDCQLGRHAPPASARPLELNKDHEL